MKKIIIFSIIFLFFCIHQVSANVIINEIMYDLSGTDTNREWIEIKNNSTNIVDLSGYKFFEANINHSLVPIGESSLQAGAYAIIVQDESSFRADWPNFNGLIFDSTFSLNNEIGELLGIKDSTGTIVDQITYNTSSEDAGKSLQKNGDSWISTIPTPGDNNATSSENNTEETSGVSQNKNEEKVVEIPKITAEIVSPSSTVIFTEAIFELMVNDYDGLPINRGKFVWNFGDGTEKIFEKNEKLTHQYKYEGEYIVTLEFYKNYYLYVPDIVIKKTINVIPLGVSIFNIDTEGSIILKNDTKEDKDISGYIILGLTHEYKIPRNTFIKSEKTLTIVSDVLPFTEEERKSLTLLYPTRKVAYTYKSENFNNNKKKTSYSVIKNTGQKSFVMNSDFSQQEILSNNLESVANISEALAYDNNIVKNEKKNSWWMYVLLLLCVMSVAILGVNFIRKRSDKENENIDDIKIVE